MAALFTALVPLIFLSTLTIAGMLAHRHLKSGSVAAPKVAGGTRGASSVPVSALPAPPAIPAVTSPVIKAAPVTTAPVTTVPASATFNGQPLGTFMVTCYDLSGTTASGAQVGPQTVAVDPSVIPLGTRIYVDGVGARIAQDTGGAILGRHLDVWSPSESQCLTWGVQSRQVWLQG